MKPLMKNLCRVAPGLLCLVCGASLRCQQAAPAVMSGPQAPASIPAPVDSLLIGPGDHLSVHVLNVPELDQPHLRVTDAGEIPLLMIGSLDVRNLTPGAAAEKIAAGYLAQNLLRSPQVQVTVDEYASSSVTVFGYIVGQSTTSQTRGTTIPLATPKPLLTVLALAGGFTDLASRTVVIQRRDQTVPAFSVAVLNEGLPDPAHNPLIYPGDTIMVPRAGLVYVLGSVGRPSAVYMTEDGRLSLLQALTQAGSSIPAAALRHVLIFRKEGSSYNEIKVDVGKVIQGKAPDLTMAAQDVIWVPFSYGKNLLVNGAGIVAAVGSATATGIVYSH